MVDSIHVARWIAQFDPTEVRFVLFPSGPNRRVHPKILELIERGKHFDNQMTLVPFGGRLSLPLWALDRFFSDRIRGLMLRRILKKIQPDFVHAQEFQHAGYVTIRALEDRTIRTPFVATNYGSDIFWFERFPSHRRRIEKILNRADFYSCECERDVSLAKQLGYKGIVLPVMPNAGGINFESLPTPKPLEQRKVIAVKGYDGWVGRARWALLALEALRDQLEDLEIVVFSANRRAIRLARLVKHRSGLRIKVYKKGALSHEQMMRLFAESRIYIGVSLSDGLSTSMLEAIANGCFAIQTSTACTEGLLEEGINGIVIKDVSHVGVTSALLRGISATASAASTVGAYNKRSLGTLSKYASSVVSEKARTSFYV